MQAPSQPFPWRNHPPHTVLASKKARQSYPRRRCHVSPQNNHAVPSSRMSTISYGKEKPVCTEATEACWGRNRRAHFTLK